MKDNSLVSIIVPIYNGEKNLAQCIESIINQTYYNIEVILVDDGSNDLSYSICKSYSVKDARVHIYRNKNSGVSYTRNYGISKCNGKYITFVDCDDYLERTAIENMLGLFDETVDLVITSCNTIADGELKVNKYQDVCCGMRDKSQLLKLYIDSGNPLLMNAPWNKLYNTEIIKNNNILFREDMNLGEDFLFNFEYCKYIKNVRIENTITYNYVIKADGLSFKKRDVNYYWNNNKMMIDKVKEYVDSKIYEICDNTLQKYIFSTLLVTLKEVFYCERYYGKIPVKLEIKRICRNFKKLYNISIYNVGSLKQKLYYIIVYFNMYKLLYFMLKYLKKRKRRI